MRRLSRFLLTIGLIAVFAFLLGRAVDQEFAVGAGATELTWRQNEILVIRARTHGCQRQLGRSLSPIAERIVAGGPPYRRWVLNLWRKRAVFYCNAARDLADPARAICATFGGECAKALRVARCESNLYVYARSRDGLYWGLFQQGAYSRSTYGFGWSALEQARAAKRHRAAEGWGPWPVCGRR